MGCLKQERVATVCASLQMRVSSFVLVPPLAKVAAEVAVSQGTTKAQRVVFCPPQSDDKSQKVSLHLRRRQLTCSILHSLRSDTLSVSFLLIIVVLLPLRTCNVQKKLRARKVFAAADTCILSQEGVVDLSTKTSFKLVFEDSKIVLV